MDFRVFAGKLGRGALGPAFLQPTHSTRDGDLGGVEESPWGTQPGGEPTKKSGQIQPEKGSGQ